MYKSKLAFVAIILALVAWVGAGAVSAQDDNGDGEDAASPGTVVEVAIDSGNFPTLVAAVQAAGLVDTLSGEGPFTVFAPTEDAFAEALAALGLSAEELLADTDLLTSVLTYHVLPIAAPAETVLGLDGQGVATVQGADVQITIDGDTVMVNDATVVTADVEASNGVIHVIDKVLLPPADDADDADDMADEDMGDGDATEDMGDDMADDDTSDDMGDGDTGDDMADDDAADDMGDGDMGDDAADDMSDEMVDDDTADDVADDDMAEDTLVETGANTPLLAIVALAVVLAGAMVLGLSRRLSTR